MIGRVRETVKGAFGLRAVWRSLLDLRNRADSLQFSVGQLHAARLAGVKEPARLRDVEFRVWSQWGEDGILEFLLSRISVPAERFVEFGVEDYREANTRFLLRHRNWSGLVMDGSARNVGRIRADIIYHHHDLTAVCAFVTAANINSLLRENGMEGDIGLLSIDVDGNDYWIWRAIDAVSPRVVVCEYNAVFGGRHAITVPYDPAFVRTRAHHSKLFFGASLGALRSLAAEKGYVFVGCNSAGVNAFFVRADCAAPFTGLAQSADFVPSRFRESVDRTGKPTFVSGPARAAAIGDCVVHDLRTGRDVRIRDLDPPPG
ncbi:MAG TPA: hypothetical protein VFZ56_08540 [Gemmatimonadaceae bacterium]